MDHRMAALAAVFTALAVGGASAAPRQDAHTAATPQVTLQPAAAE